MWRRVFASACYLIVFQDERRDRAGRRAGGQDKKYKEKKRQKDMKVKTLRKKEGEERA